MQDGTLKTLTELFSLGQVIAALAIIALGWGALRVLQGITSALANRFNRYRLQISRIFPILRIGIWALAIYLILVDVFNPPQNTLLTVLASAGLAVGLASQDLLKNIISGIYILFEQPFRVGDMVRIGEHYGEVVGIDLRSIRLHTFEDSMVTIPNSAIMSESVSNSNSGALEEMVLVDFVVPATADVESVKDMAWEAAVSSPYIYLKKPVTVLVEDAFNRTFLTRIKVKGYVLDIRLERLLASDIQQRIKKTLIRRNIVTDNLIQGTLQG